MTSGWDRYWRDRSRRGCVPNAMPAYAAPLAQTWATFASSLPPEARVLDIAAGDGAVARALKVNRSDLSITGVDLSREAAGMDGTVVIGGVDAAALPFEAATFDAATSQFGVEYCSQSAIAECARVLREGGEVRWLMHDVASAVVRHNLTRLAAAQALLEAGLFVSARRVAAGLGEETATVARIAAVRRSYASQSIAEELPAALGQALRGSGAVVRIAEIEAALADECARLRALGAAAIDERGAMALCDRADAVGITLRTTRLPADDGTPLAWLATGIRR